MCKKTCSSSRGDIALPASVSRVFGPFVPKTAVRLSELAKRHPKTLFSLMIVQLLGSMFLCFTGLPARPAAPRLRVHAVGPPGPEIPPAGELGTALTGMLAIRNHLDSLSRLRTLSRADSARLRSDAEFFKSLSGLMVRQSRQPAQHLDR